MMRTKFLVIYIYHTTYTQQSFHIEHDLTASYHMHVISVFPYFDIDNHTA